MIQFYKPNKKVTGTACSFWLNRDGAVMASMIKQDSWNDSKRIGSFAKNKDNPNKRVITKLSNVEVAGIIDVLESNREFSEFHRSKNQTLQIRFCPYLRNDSQVGFSFSINKTNNEDSTNKVGFIIGFTFAEGRYLKEFLLNILGKTFVSSEDLVPDEKPEPKSREGSEVKFDLSSDLSAEEEEEIVW